jgi:hypothetical protein
VDRVKKMTEVQVSFGKFDPDGPAEATIKIKGSRELVMDVVKGIKMKTLPERPKE